MSGGPCLVVCWTRYLHDRDPSAHSAPRVYRLQCRQDAQVLSNALDDLCDDLAGKAYELVARVWPPTPEEAGDLEVRAAALEFCAAHAPFPDGTPGVRDVDAPCADYDPASRAEVVRECAGDGHYLCGGCARHAPGVTR